MTTKAQAKEILRKVGLKGEWHRTGHPDWERCFIKKDGVTYGRQSYLNGELYSTKWYGTNGIEFEVFCIEMLISHNFLPTRQQYDLTWYWAEKAASLEYARKRQNVCCYHTRSARRFLRQILESGSGASLNTSGLYLEVCVD